MPEQQPRSETPVDEIEILTDARPIIDIASALCGVPGFKTSLSSEQFEELLINQWKILEEKIVEQNASLTDVSVGDPIALSGNLYLTRRDLNHNRNTAGANLIQEFGSSWRLPDSHTVCLDVGTNLVGSQLKGLTLEEHVPDKDNLSSSRRNVSISYEDGELNISVTRKTYEYYSNYPSPSSIYENNRSK